MSDICFALRNHREYYVANNECYALAYPEYRKMVRTGACGTIKCPFYKPNRRQLRLGNRIVGWNRKKKEETK